MDGGDEEFIELTRAAHDPTVASSLRDLAHAAHRSPWNLHRHFRRVVGEPPGSYGRRVRLDRAAARLLTSDVSVTELSIETGFDSPDGFARAFRRRFDVSPSAYRQRGLSGAASIVDHDRHVALVDAVSPCIGLYHHTSHTRSTPMSVEIVEKDVPGFTALVVRRHVTPDQIAAAMGECLPLAFGRAQQHGLALVSPPFNRYVTMGRASFEIECGVAVGASAAEAAVATGDGVEVVEIAGGRALSAVHRGSYDTLGDTYAAIETYMADNGVASGGPPWETYLTDPGDHPDAADWQTEIIQPIRS
jgi:AraC family transcriptional regulator